MPKNAYDNLMLQYYQVMNNAWKTQIKDAAKKAIINLSSLSDFEKINSQFVEDTMFLINQSLGEEFAAEITKPTKIFMEKCVKYGLADAKRDYTGNISIGLYGASDSKLAGLAQKQHLFWVGKHFEGDLQAKFQTSINQALQNGMRKHELADLFKTQFKALGRSDYYWQGMAEHTALRTRQFGRLQGYRKAGAKGYMLSNPMDDRTSIICHTLVSENKVYPLGPAVETMDKLLAIDPQKIGLERARDEIKALAPWVKEKDIVKDEKGEPMGVSGSHTPFPPFHWK